MCEDEFTRALITGAILGFCFGVINTCYFGQWVKNFIGGKGNKND